MLLLPPNEEIKGRGPSARTDVQTEAGGFLQRNQASAPLAWPGLGQVCLELTQGGQESQEPHDDTPTGQKRPGEQTLPEAQGWIPGHKRTLSTARPPVLVREPASA